MQINWLEYDIYIHGGADCKIYFMDTDRKHNRLMIGGSDKYSGQWFTNECGQPPLQSTSKTKCKDASTSLLVFFFRNGRHVLDWRRIRGQREGKGIEQATPPQE